MKVKVIYDEPGIFKCQVIERRLFNLDLFDTETAVFPRQVFNHRFDSYRFMGFNDWFHTAEDYNSLISFLNFIGETNFYASCPPPFLVNPVAFTIDATHGEFQKGLRYGQDKDNYSKDILTSPASFYYGERDKWAIVLDITNNLVIVGLMASVVEPFKIAFQDKIFDTEGIIHWMQSASERMGYIYSEDEKNVFTQILRDYSKDIES
jgi:hypothetical protein